MWRLKVRLRPVIAFHFAIHFALFFSLSWVILSLLLRFDPVTVTAAGFLLTVASLVIELLMGASQVVNHLDPRWLDEAADPVLWALIQGEAGRAGIKITRVGVIDSETPNAVTVASLTGGPVLLFTKGLMHQLSYRETRTVIAYMIGASKSGFLGAATMFAGLLILSYRLTGRYIESRVDNGGEQLIDKVLAALGYIPFALTVSQYVKATRPATTWGDRYAVDQTGDPSSYLMALLKVADGTASRPGGANRTLFTPVKGLMFIDPTMAMRDNPGLMDAAMSHGIRLEMIPGYGSENTDSSGIEYHVFEWFMSQPSPLERFRWAISAGKKMESPLKLGLAWIE
jgi:Zn-dependent protease with chaperone function